VKGSSAGCSAVAARPSEFESQRANTALQPGLRSLARSPAQVRAGGRLAVGHVDHLQTERQRDEGEILSGVEIRGLKVRIKGGREIQAGWIYSAEEDADKEGKHIVEWGTKWRLTARERSSTRHIACAALPHVS